MFLEYVDLTQFDIALQDAAKRYAAVVDADDSFEAHEAAYEALQDEVGDHEQYMLLEEVLGF